MIKKTHIYISVIIIVAIFQIPKLYKTWSDHDIEIKKLENKPVSVFKTGKDKTKLEIPQQ